MTPLATLKRTFSEAEMEEREGGRGDGDVFVFNSLYARTCRATTPIKKLPKV